MDATQNASLDNPEEAQTPRIGDVQTVEREQHDEREEKVEHKINLEFYLSHS